MAILLPTLAVSSMLEDVFTMTPYPVRLLLPFPYSVSLGDDQPQLKPLAVDIHEVPFPGDSLSPILGPGCFHLEACLSLASLSSQPCAFPDIVP